MRKRFRKKPGLQTRETIERNSPMGSRQSTRSVAVSERLTAATAIGLDVVSRRFMEESSPSEVASN
jgi:hypothetical protein